MRIFAIKQGNRTIDGGKKWKSRKGVVLVSFETFETNTMIAERKN